MAAWPRLGVGVAVMVVTAALEVHAAHRRLDPPDTPHLQVRLSTAAALPPSAKAAMVAEATAIWAEAGVVLDWDGPSDAPPGPGALRVLVVSPARRANSAGHTWAVAELLRDQHQRPLAVASIDAARQVLQAMRRPHEPEAMLSHRLGVVLGRAIAHEIGHHLLASAGHARHGLMRARIDAGDFADLRHGGFALDRDAAAAARVALTRLVDAPLRVAAHRRD